MDGELADRAARRQRARDRRRARSARRSRSTSRARASGGSGIVDDDDVELSNLHRQPLHFTPDVGEPKAESAAAKLRFLNPEIVVESYRMRVDETNVAGLIEGQDLVIDCSDTFATRYAVNQACCEAGIDLVEGGAVGWSGLVMTIVPERTACYRCAFPTARPARRRARRRASPGPSRA